MKAQKVPKALKVLEKVQGEVEIWKKAQEIPIAFVTHLPVWSQIKFLTNKRRMTLMNLDSPHAFAERVEFVPFM